MSGNFQDQLDALSQALRQADERVVSGQFALEMIHEIRNPLEALTNLVYLCTLQENSEPTKIYLAMAEEQLRTITLISGQTLGFARQLQSPVATDMANIAEAALRVHNRAIKGKQLQVSARLGKEVEAEVHRGEMLQLLSNLIGNAIDAMDNRGTLCIRLRKFRGEVQLTVTDNGHGIAKENIDQILKPFFTTKTERGVGLGLAISTDIVDRHHGRIKIRSSVDSLKRGTIFKVSIPIRFQVKT